ncbi:hypothetical protein DBZ36_08020 [Alginatibacterium sediminis]|uniref:DUF2884 family protein n=1 Tax=Alginatibacterium sediminis TaxID=2164068 RepID=A0A420EIA0_9ALTE|nr:hypothetical protein [Alginatibacterium sediminis]RKF20374.1 hypothetical protein DBZ36_08020 [Alginatibacterium sediminis]
MITNRLAYVSRKICLTILLLCLPTTSIAAESSKVFHSVSLDYDARLIVVPFSEETDNNHYIISFDGLEKYLPMQTGLYEKQRIDNSQEYQYQLIDTPLTHLRSNQGGTLIDSNWIDTYRVYLPDGLKFDVVYAGEADIVKARNIRASYALEQGQFESKIAAKREVAKAQLAFEEQCQHSVEINLNWKQFADAGQKALPGQFAKSLLALQQICAIDADYKEAIQDISKISVLAQTQGQAQSIELNANQLTFKLVANAANVQLASFHHILDLL